MNRRRRRCDRRRDDSADRCARDFSRRNASCARIADRNAARAADRLPSSRPCSGVSTNHRRRRCDTSRPTRCRRYTLRIARVGQNRMQTEAARAGHPVWTLRMVEQRLDRAKGLAAIVGAKSAAGSAPPNTTLAPMSGAGSSAHTAFSVSPLPAGNLMLPSSGSCQLAPKSSDQLTSAPQCMLI